MHSLNGFLVFLVLQATLLEASALINHSAIIQIRPSWQTLTNHNPANPAAIVRHSDVTIINRGKNPMNLLQFTLQWRPTHPVSPAKAPSFTPVLYRENKHHSSMPSAGSYVACGCWNPAAQTITFSFEKEPYKVIGTERLFLIVHTPPHNLEALHGGHFIHSEEQPPVFGTGGG